MCLDMDQDKTMRNILQQGYPLFAMEDPHLLAIQALIELRQTFEF